MDDSDHAKPGDSEEGECQVASSGQRTYPRGQIDGKFQVAKTTKAGANLVSASSSVGKHKQEVGNKYRKKQTKEKKKKEPPTPLSAITGAGTVNKTPVKPHVAQKNESYK